MIIIIIIILMITTLQYLRQYLGLNSQVFWEGTLCRWVSGTRRFEAPWCLNLHGVKQPRHKVGHHHLVLLLRIRIAITSPPPCPAMVRPQFSPKGTCDNVSKGEVPLLVPWLLPVSITTEMPHTNLCSSITDAIRLHKAATSLNRTPFTLTIRVNGVVLK
jgi:hypothetical protein